MLHETLRYWYACCFTDAMICNWYYVQDGLSINWSGEVFYKDITDYDSQCDAALEWLRDETWSLEGDPHRSGQEEADTWGWPFMQEWGEIFLQVLALARNAPWPSLEWQLEIYYIGALRGVLSEFQAVMAHLEQPRLQERYQRYAAPWQKLIAALGVELASLDSHPDFSPTQVVAVQEDIARFAAQTVSLWRSYLKRAIEAYSHPTDAPTPPPPSP